MDTDTVNGMEFTYSLNEVVIKLRQLIDFENRLPIIKDEDGRSMYVGALEDAIRWINEEAGGNTVRDRMGLVHMFAELIKGGELTESHAYGEAITLLTDGIWA